MTTTTTQERSLYERLHVLNEQLAVHFRRHWLKWAIVMVLAYAAQLHYMIGINISPSLPQKVFLIVKGEKVGKGDYAAFYWHGQGGFYPEQKYFTKQVIGVEGDVVSVHGQEVFINGEKVAVAKQKSSLGRTMHIITPKTLAQGEYYMYAPNPDSLDSRYSEVGFIATRDLMGRAYPIF